MFVGNQYVPSTTISYTPPKIRGFGKFDPYFKPWNGKFQFHRIFVVKLKLDP